MKIRPISYSLLLLLCLFLSCEREPSRIAVTGVKVTPEQINLIQGETTTLTASILPPNASDPVVNWSSSDISIATVSDGTVTAIAPGSAEIRVTTKDGGFQSVCHLTVDKRGLSFTPGQDFNPVFEAKGGTVSISFKASSPWSVSVLGDKDIDWILLEPGQGDVGNATVTFTVAENPDYEGRSASFRISCDDDVANVVITQKQKDDLTISASIFEIGPEGDTVEIEVKSNIEYTYKIEGYWIKAVETKAYDARTLYFEVATNDDIQKREGTITFSGGGFSEAVIIYQDGVVPSLVLSQNTFDVSSDGGEIRVDVRSNVDVTVEMPADAPWVQEIRSRAVSTHTFYFSITANNDYESRSAKILFTNRDTGLSEEVIIYQDGAVPSLVLSQNTFDVSSDGGEIRVDVLSNVDVTVEMPADAPWVQEIRSRAMSTHTFYFSISANNDYESRSAKILFTNRDIGLSEEVIINQAQNDDLILTNAEVTVPYSGGSFEISLQTNVEYEIRIDGDWIKEVPTTRGLESQTNTFIADPLAQNQFDRTATISFIALSGNLKETVTVRQKDDSPIIDFKDQVIKAICVDNWDWTKDGELSEHEAAAVTDIHQTFNSNQSATSFEELRYFSGLHDLADYSFTGCSNLRSVILPEGIGRIGKAAFQYAGIEGELILPASINVLAEDCFNNCINLRSIVLPEALTELGESALAQTGLEGEIIIPDSVKVIPDFCFADCYYLRSVILHNFITHLGDCAFANCNSLSFIEILADEVPSCGRQVFQSTVDYPIYVPAGKASTYQQTKGWWEYQDRITERGHLPNEFFYASTDYSRDGEVICLQKATKGRGVNIIFLGDGYVDKDMEPGGEYETIMRGWMEQFFVYEPYKSFREWFNIYTVKVVSGNSVYDSPYSNQRLTRVLKEGETSQLGSNTIVVENSLCFEYANKVPNPYGQSLKVALFTNTDNHQQQRSFCSLSSNGNCLAINFNYYATGYTRRTLNHELGGHGFAFLGDEYVEYHTAHSNPQYLRDEHKYGWKCNLDWRSDPKEVCWSRFLEDPRYANEGLGVFEGGGMYAYGIYRSTEYGIMGTGFNTGMYFNAPSREAIYKNIMQAGVGESWVYDYEEFVKDDEAGRKEAAAAYATYSRQSRSSIERMEDFSHDLPPIFVDDDVKEIMITNKGDVTLIR